MENRVYITITYTNRSTCLSTSHLKPGRAITQRMTRDIFFLPNLLIKMIRVEPSSLQDSHAKSLHDVVSTKIAMQELTAPLCSAP